MYSQVIRKWRTRVEEIYKQSVGVDVPEEPGLTLTEKVNGAGEKVKVMYVMEKIL